MKESFIRAADHYGEKITLFEGVLCHTTQSSSNRNVWLKIMTDLYLILKSHALIITNTNSNFARICVPMRNPITQQVYFVKDRELAKLNDPSSFFAQHYMF